MNEISAPVAPVAADTSCVGSYPPRNGENGGAIGTVHVFTRCERGTVRAGQSPLIKRLRHSAMLVPR